MGPKHSTETDIPEDCLEDLKYSTQFTSEELQDYYERFQDEFPDGHITKQQFIQMYSQKYPDGDARKFAEYVFNAHDLSKSGTVDFKVYIILYEKRNN